MPGGLWVRGKGCVCLCDLTCECGARGGGRDLGSWALDPPGAGFSFPSYSELEVRLVPCPQGPYQQQTSLSPWAKESGHLSRAGCVDTREVAGTTKSVCQEQNALSDVPMPIFPCLPSPSGFSPPPSGPRPHPFPPLHCCRKAQAECVHVCVCANVCTGVQAGCG